MPNIFSDTTLCDSSCTVPLYTAPRVVICDGVLISTKKVKVAVFDCDVDAADLATTALIKALETANKLRVFQANMFSKPAESPITSEIDPKKPPQTIGYNFEMEFRDVLRFVNNVNYDVVNEVAAKILNSHLFYVDEDNDRYLYRTDLAIEVSNPYTTGESDYKYIAIKLKGKYFISTTQPHANKPTNIPGLYKGL